MKTIRLLTLLLIAPLVLSSCIKVIRPGEVGVKRKAGKLKPHVYEGGTYMINPFTTRMLKVPTRLINHEVLLEPLPSKEGLSISVQMSILFHIVPDSALHIVTNIGIDNSKSMITNVLRSSAADVTSNYFAKDMHSGGKREEIEQAISEKMMENLRPRGFIVDAVLMKSLRLPAGLTQAIETKLRAEQEAQQMEFVLNREKSEAERKRIEAEGIKEYNRIINESINQTMLQYKSIEAFRELSKSENAKVIITDGKTPMLINVDE